jgi:hypothetical protein
MVKMKTILLSLGAAGVAVGLLQSLLAQDVPTTRSATLLPALSPDQPASVIETNTPQARSRFTGTGSCSAVACHGGVGRKDCATGSDGEIWRSEYTVWITDDPHSRAYSVLFNDTARTIARNMAGGGKVIDAWQDKRCLACHSLPRSEREFAETARFNADGVGCESCHGPAANWLGEHTTTSWKLLDAHTKEQNYQFRNTKNLVSRTETCLGCHLGKRGDGDLVDRDMNHDMVAAGHPRLNFEMAAFSDLHPNHWCEKPQQWSEAPQQAEADASFRNAWLWATGKLVTAASGLEMAAARAESRNTPWPEFSETNCYSCHQPLTADPVRIKKTGELPGRPAWGTWFLDGVESLIPENPQGTALKTKLSGEFTRLMQSPLPSREKTSAECRAIAGELRKMAVERNHRGFGEAEIRGVISRGLSQNVDTKPKAWDTDAQNFLALSAMARTHGRKMATPEVIGKIDLLRARLNQQAEATSLSPSK